MIYLVLHMALYLILAALAGVGIGWWFNQIRNNSHVIEELDEEDLFAIKHRLDKCFDDNAKLRRDLKSSNHHSQKIAKGNGSNTSSRENLKEKLQVLMDDLQLRDDTILVLERELEITRNSSS